MAEFTLDSNEITSFLNSLLTRLAGAIGWVGQHPQEITIEVMEDIWHHYGGTEAPRKVNPNCLCALVPEERAEVEILLGVLTKMGSKGTRRPKTKRRK